MSVRGNKESYPISLPGSYLKNFSLAVGSALHLLADFRDLLRADALALSAAEVRDTFRGRGKRHSKQTSTPPPYRTFAHYYYYSIHNLSVQPRGASYIKTVTRLPKSSSCFYNNGDKNRRGQDCDQLSAGLGTKYVGTTRTRTAQDMVSRYC